MWVYIRFSTCISFFKIRQLDVFYMPKEFHFDSQTFNGCLFSCHLNILQLV